jgi:hypothetical protein
MQFPSSTASARYPVIVPQGSAAIKPSYTARGRLLPVHLQYLHRLRGLNMQTTSPLGGLRGMTNKIW